MVPSELLIVSITIVVVPFLILNTFQLWAARVLMMSEIHFFPIVCLLRVHSEVVRVRIVREGTSFVLLKLMRLHSQLEMLFLALIWVFSYVIQGDDPAESPLMMASLVSL